MDKKYILTLFKKFHKLIEEGFNNRYTDIKMNTIMELLREEGVIFLVSDDPKKDKYHVAIVSEENNNEFIFKDEEVGLDFTEEYEALLNNTL